MPTTITITVEELAAETGIDLTQHTPQQIAAFPELTGGYDANLQRARRLFAVASEAVNHFAPAAPAVMKNEAIIRFAGYLTGSDYGGVKSEGVDPRNVEYTPPATNAAMFRNCGAASLLTRYRVRRAGSVG